MTNTPEAPVAPRVGRMPFQVAMLGVGIMGSAMARRLLSAQFPVTVWDRSTDTGAPSAVWAQKSTIDGRSRHGR
jgi:3-hydroxyacyl-CoA dehydrogenase